MSDQDLIPKPLNVHKQRQYNTIARTHRYNHENQGVRSSAPASRNTGGRRAVSASVTVSKHATAVYNDPEHVLRSQPSLKHRLLNRMMSGLSSKALISGIDEEDENAQQTASIAQSRCDASRNSSASSNSNRHGLADLDKTLAAFPSPPTSHATIQKTDHSSESARLPVQASRDLCVPRKHAALAAELRIIPCPGQQHSDQSMLVAVEIRATTKDPSPEYEPLSQRSVLEVAVVIDNSLYNSPALLMASCDITSLLASFLDTTTDRIAILCTMPTDAKHDTCNPVTLAPLGRINTQKLKAILDNVASSVVQPDARVLIAAIKQAQQILFRPERFPSLCEPVHETFGHVIVLTADASGLLGQDFDSDTIQTHILCTGIPREGIWNEIECNGWKMSLMSAFLTRNRPHHSRSKKDIDPRSLNNRLQALVRYARSGKFADFLTDVVLDIEPQYGFGKDKTLGSSSYSKVRIGETKTVLVSLLYEGRFTKPASSIDTEWYDLCASSNSDDLVEEIDRMLGLPKDGMITAKLSYKHSLLPMNTTCTTVARSRLKLQLPLPEGRKSIGKLMPSKSASLLNQRLAEYYAAYYKPQDALSALQQEFGKEGCHSACPVYIIALTDELKYQARISERIAIEHSPRKPTTRSQGPHFGTVVDHARPSLLYSENCKLRDWMKVPDEEFLVPDGSRLEVVEQLGLDDAWRIWNDLRNMARGEKPENGAKISTSMDKEEQLKKIKEMALKRKGSLGGSTMRSFSSPLQRVH